MVMPISEIVPRFDSETEKENYLARIEAMLMRHSEAAAQWRALGFPKQAEAHERIFHDLAGVHDKITGGDIRRDLFGGA